MLQSKFVNFQEACGLIGADGEALRQYILLEGGFTGYVEASDLTLDVSMVVLEPSWFYKEFSSQSGNNNGVYWRQIAESVVAIKWPDRKHLIVVEATGWIELNEVSLGRLMREGGHIFAFYNLWISNGDAPPELIDAVPIEDPSKVSYFEGFYDRPRDSPPFFISLSDIRFLREDLIKLQMKLNATMGAMNKERASSEVSYPRELQAAMDAYHAVIADPSLTRSTSPKAAIMSWLITNRVDLSAKARERIATIANWQPGGGAPLTPSE